jgi:hypothetical protein
VTPPPRPVRLSETNCRREHWSNQDRTRGMLDSNAPLTHRPPPTNWSLPTAPLLLRRALGFKSHSFLGILSSFRQHRANVRKAV